LTLPSSPRRKGELARTSHIRKKTLLRSQEKRRGKGEKEPTPALGREKNASVFRANLRSLTKKGRRSTFPGGKETGTPNDILLAKNLFPLRKGERLASGKEEEKNVVTPAQVFPFQREGKCSQVWQRGERVPRPEKSSLYGGGEGSRFRGFSGGEGWREGEIALKNKGEILLVGKTSPLPGGKQLCRSNRPIRGGGEEGWVGESRQKGGSG